ncbi:MAG: hypothetical protein ISEC1_P0764 [Thiomicrorhabdus sp.]|nr:MAG: hypothetical protein ISEC1_P0764 [Thiomicrorhabdus sp.]
MNINTALAAYNSHYDSGQAKAAETIESNASLEAKVATNIHKDKSLEISQEGLRFLASGQETMSRYNIQDASPREIAAMSLELYDNKVISLEEHAMLSFQPELNAEQFEDIFGKAAEPDEARDFIVEWQNKLNEQRSGGTPLEFSKNTQQIIHLLNNLQSMSEG